MKRFIGFLILLMTLLSHAHDTCRQFYVPSVNTWRTAAIQGLKNRIWLQLDIHSKRPNAVSERVAANELIQHLETHGSEIDFKILETYLATLEKIKFFGSSSGQTDFQTSSHFWNWSALKDYFLTSEPVFSKRKDFDLQYLKYVETSPELYGQLPMLDRVLEMANHRWARHQLRRFRSAAPNYDVWSKGNNSNTSIKALRLRFKAWEEQSTSLTEKASRVQLASEILNTLKQANSRLDVFISELFLDLLSDYKFDFSIALRPDSKQALVLTNHKLLGDLFKGRSSLLGLSKLLRELGHDVPQKGYLIEILLLLKSKSETVPRDMSHFLKALEESLYEVKKPGVVVPVPFPKNHESDLITFTQRATGVPGEAVVFDLVRMEWNMDLGRFETKIQDTLSQAQVKSMTVGQHWLLADAVVQYFDVQRALENYSREEIDLAERLELEAPLENSTFFIFSSAELTKNKSMLRLFDATNGKTYIEIEFPHIVLPGRENGESIFEVGRAFSLFRPGEKVFPIMAAKIAKYLETIKARGFLYVDVNADLRDYHLRYGATDVFTPEQLRISSKQTPQWVMRYSVKQWIEQFLPLSETSPRRQPIEP